MCSLEKRGNIFFLTLTSDGQHLLNPTLISSIRSSLSQVKSQSTTPGTVLLTLAQGNFFSNGFDLHSITSIDLLHHTIRLFKELASDLVSLPMPTIAAVTGHAAAAGLLLAMSHDYVLMGRDRGVLYMSELDLGIALQEEYAMALVRSKVARPGSRRDVLLRGMKVRAEEAVAKGLIDSVYDSGEETVEAGMRLGEELGKRRWDGEVYAEIRKSLYPEICGVLGLTTSKSIVKARL